MNESSQVQYRNFPLHETCPKNDDMVDGNNLLNIKSGVENYGADYWATDTMGLLFLPVTNVRNVVCNLI